MLAETNRLKSQCTHIHTHTILRLVFSVLAKGKPPVNSLQHLNKCLTKFSGRINNMMTRSTQCNWSLCWACLSTSVRAVVDPACCRDHDWHPISGVSKQLRVICVKTKHCFTWIGFSAHLTFLVYWRSGLIRKGSQFPPCLSKVL